MKTERIIDLLSLSPSPEELKNLKINLKKFLDKINSVLKKDKIDAKPFLGGSYAKGTLLKNRTYEIDIFLRFNKKYQNISDLTEKELKRIFGEENIEIKHGSRKYFRIRNENCVYEIVPVVNIKKNERYANVTDLSYFHVNYIKSKINEKLKKEILIAKAFCKANKFYGAESYISGFSGYALECLVIYYGSFEKMLKKIVANEEKIIIDMEKEYKNKKEVFYELNESKTSGPMVLIDPVSKDRNILAGLSKETFIDFIKVSKKYLNSKKIDYFMEKKIDSDFVEREANRLKCERILLEISTNKEEGDIAGTKMKKFWKFFKRTIERYMEIKKEHFVYSGGKNAVVYFLAKNKKSIEKTGPYIKFEKDVERFKKYNADTFLKNGRIYSKIIIKDSEKHIAREIIRNYNKTVKDMDITEAKIL